MVQRLELPWVVATGYAEQASDLDVRLLREPYAIVDLLNALHDADSAARREASGPL